MVTKMTYKARQLQHIFDTAPEFAGAKLDMRKMTVRQAKSHAATAGYIWDREAQTWKQTARSLERAKRMNNTGNGSLTSDRRQIRIMGPVDDLNQLAGDFGELAELIGLRVLEISSAKPNRDGSAWGRIYITVERI